MPCISYATYMVDMEHGGRQGGDNFSGEGVGIGVGEAHGKQLRQPWILNI